MVIFTCMCIIIWARKISCRVLILVIVMITMKIGIIFVPLYFWIVQEEIRFTVCPELVSSLLFMEYMDDNEAIIIQGYEQFSETTGYGPSFTYVGDHKDPAQVGNKTTKQIYSLLLIFSPIPIVSIIEIEKCWRTLLKIIFTIYTSL